MGFNPFGTVGDYPGMLNKIATFVLFEAILAVWCLRWKLPAVDAALAPLTLPIPIGSGLSIPFGTFLPAFVYAMLSRVVKWHDRLSDILLIRKRFDVEEILFPLAIITSGGLDPQKIHLIRKQREDLMYKVFYKYASSSPGKAVIESHYITMALDQWCWYWVVLEGTFVALTLSLVFFFSERHLAASLVLLGILASIALLEFIRAQCSDYAFQEVEQIVADTTRRDEIAEVFRAL